MAVHVYTGDGKGKTTCAAGLAARCAGRGKKVCFYRFLKCEDSGECLALQSMMEFFCVQRKFGFLFQMNETEKEEIKKETYALWQNAKQANCDLLVLDEILGAVQAGFVPESELLEWLAHSSEKEIVLTGRNASNAVIQAADYVTEMKCVKHIYDKGVPAREGIEY